MKVEWHEFGDGHLPECGRLCEIQAIEHTINNDRRIVCTIGRRILPRDWRVLVLADNGRDFIPLMTAEGNIQRWRVWAEDFVKGEGCADTSA